MSRRPSSLQALFAELKRRHVFRVMAVYGAVAFVILQIADLAFEPLGLPPWTMTFVLMLSILGFPVAIVLAWAFEQTPEGIRRTEKAAPEEIEALVAEPRHRRWPAGIAALVGVALLVAGAWWMGRSGAGAAGRGDGTEDVWIAVLPLTIRTLGGGAAETSGDAEQAALFADGMHDDLLTQLSRFGDLNVISRTSVEQFRDTDLDIRDIAARLGVRYVMEGAVEKVGDDIRVNAQLIDASSEGHVWAETYDETMTLDNFFAIRDALTRRIASSLQATLSPEVAARIDERPTENAEAFELYTRGRHLYERGARPDLERAIELFERAVELDPKFAGAYAALASAHGRMVAFGFVPTSRGQPAAQAAVERALELDPDNADALMGRAIIEWQDGNARAAHRTLDRVLELYPSHADAHATLGRIYDAQGFEKEALEEVERAAALDPLSAAIQDLHVEALQSVGRDREALEQASTLMELHPEYEPAAGTLSRALAEVGRVDEAIETYRQALRRDPNSIFTNEGLAWTLLQTGRQDEALDQIERAAELTPDDYPIQTSKSLMLRGRGRFDEAVDAARRAVQLAPEDPSVRGLLSGALLAVGDTAGAQAQLDTAMALGRDGNATFGLSQVTGALLRAGRADDAVTYSRRVVDRRPGYPFQLARHARLMFETSPWADHGPEAALPLFEQARALSPREDYLLRDYGQTLRELGRTDESLPLFEALVEDQPGSSASHRSLGWERLIGQRDLAGAEKAFRASLALNPAEHSALWGLARVRARECAADSAYALMERVETVCSYPGCPDDFRVREAWLRAVAGDEAGARDLLARYEEQRAHPDWPEWLPILAATHAELGEIDEAFRQLNLAYELRSTRLLELKVEPWFDPLRDDPRFGALLAKMGFD